MLRGLVQRWSKITAAAAFCCLLIAPIALAKKPVPDHPVDLNAASAKELEELPGIGPTTANAIIAFRVKSGRIRRVEDLLAIRGVSEAKLKKLRPYVTLGTPATAPPAAKKTITPHATVSNKPSHGSALNKPPSSAPKIAVTPQSASSPPQQ